MVVDDPHVAASAAVYMGRTNIDIDDQLVAEAMRRYGLSSKRAAVEFASRRLIAMR